VSFIDPYNAYTEGSVFSGNPLETVVALYEGTIECIREARQCLATGDIWGRSKAVNKSIALLTELLVSLNHKEGGEISANLKQLYSYIQCRILDAHTQKSQEPLNESERLLTTMLEGWRMASEKVTTEAHSAKSFSSEMSYTETPIEEDNSWRYGFFNETAELAGCVSATF